MFAYIKELSVNVKDSGADEKHREKDLEISDLLIKWYKNHQRDLPWRKSRDPYIIWISEIILQQTRVVQGMDYFLRFVKRFPNVVTLATAEEDEILKYWQGLGYYSRARNLHAAAKMIIKLHDGSFPRTYKEVLSLKGIGEYTAAAIVSFVYDDPYPVVDGNVYRVLSRLFAVGTPIDTTEGKRLFRELAAELINEKSPGLHNQAIMEFGALQCIPQSPDCNICPLNQKCLAYAQGDVCVFPVKQGKTKVRNRYFNYINILYKGQTWLHRRSGKDIWNGLYEFPLIETDGPVDFAELEGTDVFRNLIKDTGELGVKLAYSSVKHVLSHQIIYANFYQIEIKQVNKALESYIRIEMADIDKYAVSRLMDIYLNKISES